MPDACKIFQVRLAVQVYQRVVALARFRGVSINSVVGDLLRRGVEAVDGRDAKDQGNSSK
jgi:hypothetical protein